jgi:flavin-dependent dehydrogenase
VLLAGDAAALVNPLFGDGILHAMRSGRIAARAVAEGAAADYTRRIHREFARNFDTAGRLSSLWYGPASGLTEQAVRLPQATRLAARLLSGDLRYGDVAAHALRCARMAVGARSRPLEAAGETGR